MKDLIKKLEAATEGSREFDAKVAEVIGFFDGQRASYSLNIDLIPYYTTSIDAALTLVPEGWSRPWIKRHNGHHWSVELHQPSTERQGRHKELPLALCIAALKARDA